MFTQTQIEEIRNKLALLGKKDTQLPKANEPLSGNEVISVVQNDESRQTTLGALWDGISQITCSGYFGIGNFDGYILAANALNADGSHKYEYTQNVGKVDAWLENQEGVMPDINLDGQVTTADFVMQKSLYKAFYEGTAGITADYDVPNNIISETSPVTYSNKYTVSFTLTTEEFSNESKNLYVVLTEEKHIPRIKVNGSTVRLNDYYILYKNTTPYYVFTSVGSLVPNNYTVDITIDLEV